MATKDVKFKLKTKGDPLAVVRVDGRKLVFDGEGAASRSCASGASHTVEYFVRGQQGSTYNLAITAPVESRLIRADTLDADGRDAGHAYFWVD